MNALHKLKTLGGLLRRAEFAEVRCRWRQFCNQRRVDAAGGKMFVYDDLGFPAVCHPDWNDSRWEFLDSQGDHKEWRLLASWLRPGDACIDVGASLGLYSLRFADKVGARGEVLSFDADAYIVEKLRAAATLLKASQVRPVWGAVTDRAGEVTFFAKSGRSGTFDQSLVPACEVASDFYRQIQVPAFALGELHRQLRRPEALVVIKVDIEGAEAAALGSVPETMIDGGGPLWQVEIHAGALQRFGARPEDVAGKFSPQHFDRWLLPKQPKVFQRLGDTEDFQNFLYYNLICIPRGERWRQRRELLMMELEVDREGRR